MQHKTQQQWQTSSDYRMGTQGPCHGISNGHENFPIMFSKFSLKFFVPTYCRTIITHFKLNFSSVSTDQPLDITMHIQHLYACMHHFESQRSVTSFHSRNRSNKASASFQGKFQTNEIITFIAHDSLKIRTIVK